MISIFTKEFNSYLNSLIAYLVIGVFLTSIGLMLWVFPETSVLDYGYADLDTLFSMGPYVFIFLIPAITMKSFAEEKKLGTLELLLTKPLSHWQIVLGKYAAAFALTLLSLAPTSVYYLTIYQLGNPIGNIDTAGVIGSYIGLSLLASVFCAIGIFASSLTGNQIVSFILAAFLSFIFYTGFDSLSTLSGNWALDLKQLGILYHYESLSKGLIDSRDVIYFLSICALILLAAKTAIGSRRWSSSASMKQKIWSEAAHDLLFLLNGIALVILLNALASFYFFRIDLTEEKRYSIKPQTKELLQHLDDDVFVEVFLEGDLNSGFKRFQKSVKETLEEFRIYSNNKVKFVFTDPAQAQGQKARSEFMKELASKGIQPMNVIETENGKRVEKFVFPGALVSYGGFETGVPLLKGNKAHNAQEVLNQSIEGTEYELVNAIYKLTNNNRKKIGLLRGHGELDSLTVASFNNSLLEQYDVFHVELSKKMKIENYQLLIIPKPKKEFSLADKYKLDQYLMHGGKIMFLLDRLEANMDSASREDYFAFPYQLNLDDQLFKYGVRINMDLIEDRVSGKYPIVVGNAGNRPQIMQLDWPFFPLINQYAAHPVTRNLDATMTKFVSSIDTVKALGVKKTPLLFTSPYTRRVTAPVKVSVDDLRRQLQEGKFSDGKITVAYLLEGNFTSLFKNRFAPEGVDTVGFLKSSLPTKIIVIADGDIARNDVNPRTGQPQQLGFDPFANYTFANQDLLLNMVAYLTDENGLINARNKEVKIRPLDKEKIKERTFWQMINIGAPLLVLLIFGIGRSYLRKRKYTRF
ncbi:MAG: gliding motility-associated ABC transporter substrate-binding protein GldG [Bacteroidetes bacterium]|nr:gliding motility-associated ABC transporter substrate-binding protein GldG [Bacteroidota bacterium]